ncbi:FkbM family methyltransferase [Nitrospira sp. Kam-Ns4a]
MILDVGSADGDKTITFLKSFPSARVLCFEPQRSKHARFHRRVAQWKDRVELFDVGLWNANTTLRMSVYSYTDASSILPIQPYLERQGKTVVGIESIQVQRLDDVLRNRGIGHVDFMKIDVEGVEKEVLEGARETLQIIDNVYVEISPLRKGPHSRDYIDAFSLLHEAGFTFMGVYGDCWFSKDPCVLKAVFGPSR